MSNGRTQIPSLALIVLALASTRVAAEPPELRLLSAASMQTVFKEVVGDFEQRSGYKVSLRYSTMGAITARVMAGEAADLIISSPASIAALAAGGRVQPGSEVTIARTGVGIVVPAGDPAPAIASIEDFKAALLAARVVVYANPAGGGAAGIHIARLIEKLGIAEQLKAKTRFGAGGDVAEVTVAQGNGALGLTQVSEIVGKPGMQFVPVPEALQNYTGFVAGRPSGAMESEATRAFIAFLRTPETIAVMKSKGMRVD
jgi:molybdate transport system substrate-binding protein